MNSGEPCSPNRRSSWYLLQPHLAAGSFTLWWNLVMPPFGRLPASLAVWPRPIVVLALLAGGAGVASAQPLSKHRTDLGTLSARCRSTARFRAAPASPWSIVVLCRLA